MDNNELNNNVQNDFKDQIMMGDTQTMPNVNQGTQPNAVNMNQGINTVIQNNINATQNIPTQEPSNDDTIFSDMESKMDEPVPTVQPTPESSIPTTQKEKKGKGSTIIIILLILTVLGLAGYICYDKFIAKDTTPKTEDTTKIEIDTKDDEKLNVEDYVYNYQEKKEIYGDVTFEYKIPNLNLDSDYAKEVNKEIAEKYKDTAKLAEGGYSISYNAFINGNILSLVIFEDNNYTSNATSYVIYNIDVKSGKKVTNKEIINYKKINESEFKNNINSTYNILVPESKWGDIGDPNKTYKDSVDELINQQLDEYVMFINDKNEICIVYLEQTIAAPHYMIMNLNTNEYEGIK